MSNEELVLAIKAEGKTAELMGMLFNQVRNFIYSIALRYQSHEDVEDLTQEGFLALYSVIDRYDPEYGTKFLTYAEHYIRQRMQRYIQNNAGVVRMAAHFHERLHKYNRLRNTILAEYNREPTNREIAYHLGISLNQVGEFKKNAQMARLGSLDSLVQGYDGDVTLGELVPAGEDMEADVLDQVQQEQLRAVIWDCVDQLPDRQPEVIRKRYQDNKTLKEIAGDYGVTPELIRQIESKAMRELRKSRHCNRLRPFMEERIYSMGVRMNGARHFDRTWTSSTEYAALRLAEWRQEAAERLAAVKNLAAENQAAK